MVSAIKMSSTIQILFRSLNKNLKIKSVTIETKIKQAKIILYSGAIPTLVSHPFKLYSKKLKDRQTKPKEVTIFKGVNLRRIEISM